MLKMTTIGANEILPVRLDEGKLAKWVYILYLCGWGGFLAHVSWVFAVLGCMPLAGLIIAYIHKGDGTPEWVDRHYHYQIRTFRNALVDKI
jgi:uncharacterized membrane protein